MHKAHAVDMLFALFSGIASQSHQSQVLLLYCLQETVPWHSHLSAPIHLQGVLEFQPGEQEQTIVIPIVDDQEYEKDEYFRVLLTDPMGGVKFDELTDGGGECCIAIVKIFRSKLSKHV